MEYFKEYNQSFPESFYEYDSNFTKNFTNEPVKWNTSDLSFFISAQKLLLPTWWKLFDEKYLRHSLQWTIALTIAYLLILIIGVIGNVMVIAVVLLRPQMRSVTNMFIMNLAVADLFVIVFCVAGTLLSHVFAPWLLGPFSCKGIAYVQGVSVCASAYSLAAISLDRCKAIYNSYGRSKGLSKNQCVWIISFIWTSALALTIPWALIFDVTKTQHDGHTYSYCVENWTDEFLGKLNFLIINFLICYCLPLLLISISNLVIWCHVNHRRVPRDSDSSGSIRRMHRKARHGVIKMLGVVTLVFILSWLPLYVLVMRIKFGESITEWEYNLHGILMPFAQWLGSWSCSVNPILYAFLNKKFRRMFVSLLPSWMPFLRESSTSYITRDEKMNGTFKSSVRSLSGMSTYSTRSSRKSNRSSGKRTVNAVERKSSTSCSTRSICVTHFRSIRDRPKDFIVELSTSPVNIAGKVDHRKCSV